MGGCLEGALKKIPLTDRKSGKELGKNSPKNRNPTVSELWGEKTSENEGGGE